MLVGSHIYLRLGRFCIKRHPCHSHSDEEVGAASTSWKTGIPLGVKGKWDSPFPFQILDETAWLAVCLSVHSIWFLHTCMNPRRANYYRSNVKAASRAWPWTGERVGLSQVQIQAEKGLTQVYLTVANIRPATCPSEAGSVYQRFLTRVMYWHCLCYSSFSLIAGLQRASPQVTGSESTWMARCLAFTYTHTPLLLQWNVLYQG